MSPRPEERPVTERVPERPRIDSGQLKDIRPRDLGYRFLAGAITSVVAGVLSIAITPRVGGFMLAFPAILGASLTLIEEQENSAEAREDCRGALIGGGAMAVFAAVVALTVQHIDGALALALATAAWFAGALGGYLVAWFR